jgi:hypothetical protein
LGGEFADALNMIARLPLTDAEKAEAVRRLLNRAVGAKPNARDLGGNGL